MYLGEIIRLYRQEHDLSMEAFGSLAGIPIEVIENIIDTEEISEKLASTGEFFGLKRHLRRCLYGYGRKN